MDSVLFDAINNTESHLSDLDKMKEIVQLIIKLRIIDLNPPQIRTDTTCIRKDYIG